MKNTAVSDEEIIAALLKCGTLQQAAEATGLSARALYDRMGNRTFRAAYSAAKSDLLRSAVLDMTRKVSEAVEVVTSIMNNEEATPATRLQAAKLILDNAAKFSDRMDCADTSTATLSQPFGEIDPSKW